MSKKVKSLIKKPKEQKITVKQEIIPDYIKNAKSMTSLRTGTTDDYAKGTFIVTIDTQDKEIISQVNKNLLDTASNLDGKEDIEQVFYLTFDKSNPICFTSSFSLLGYLFVCLENLNIPDNLKTEALQKYGEDKIYLKLILTDMTDLV